MTFERGSGRCGRQQSERSVEPLPPGSAGGPRLSIIVVSYNTREMTLAALRSVVRETRNTPYEIIVVDNASADGSASAIAAALPGIRLIVEDRNIGFARACNIAAAQARGDLLLFLNSDTVILDGAVDSLVRFAESRPSAGIWGGRSVFADGSLNPTNCARRPTLWSLLCLATGLSHIFAGSAIFNAEEYGGWDRGTEREVDIVQGSFLLIGKGLWQELGGFDPTYVMYGEETDLCLRARMFGARPRVSPVPTIVHHLGGSFRQRAAMRIMLLKAKATLIRHHMPPWQRAPALWLLGMWPLSRMLGLQLGFALTRQARFPRLAAGWTAVWAARSDWRAGWPESRAGPHTPGH